MTMFFKYKTECPRCGNKSEVGLEKPDQTVNCGHCLMNDVEVVRLKLTYDGEEYR